MSGVPSGQRPSSAFLFHMNTIPPKTAKNHCFFSKPLVIRYLQRRNPRNRPLSPWGMEIFRVTIPLAHGEGGIANGNSTPRPAGRGVCFRNKGVAPRGEGSVSGNIGLAPWTEGAATKSIPVPQRDNDPVPQNKSIARRPICQSSEKPDPQLWRYIR